MNGPGRTEGTTGHSGSSEVTIDRQKLERVGDAVELFVQKFGEARRWSDDAINCMHDLLVVTEDLLTSTLTTMVVGSDVQRKRMLDAILRQILLAHQNIGESAVFGSPEAQGLGLRFQTLAQFLIRVTESSRAVDWSNFSSLELRYRDPSQWPSDLKRQIAAIKNMLENPEKDVNQSTALEKLVNNLYTYFKAVLVFNEPKDVAAIQVLARNMEQLADQYRGQAGSDYPDVPIRAVIRQLLTLERMFDEYVRARVAGNG